MRPAVGVRALLLFGTWADQPDVPAPIASIHVLQVRKRDNGHVSIGECSYPDVDDPLSSPAQSPSINSIPPSAMAAAAAAAGVDAVSSFGSTDSDDSSSFAGSSSAGLGPPTFGSSFISDDDPYAWAQKLRRIPDKVGLFASLLAAHWRT